MGHRLSFILWEFDWNIIITNSVLGFCLAKNNETIFHWINTKAESWMCSVSTLLFPRHAISDDIKLITNDQTYCRRLLTCNRDTRSRSVWFRPSDDLYYLATALRSEVYWYNGFVIPHISSSLPPSSSSFSLSSPAANACTHLWIHAQRNLIYKALRAFLEQTSTKQWRKRFLVNETTGPLLGLELKTDRHPPTSSQTSYPLRLAAHLCINHIPCSSHAQLV